jgi:acetoin utilization deacetylase AcuC-like enzyme
LLPFALVFHDKFNFELGPRVFPAQKYRLLRERLLESGLASPSDFVAAPPASDEDLRRVHTPDYLRKLTSGDFTLQEARLLELPWSAALVEALRWVAGGAIEAGRRALDAGCAILVGGGFHHAFADHGEGFCLLNDVAIAIRALRAGGHIERAAVIDLDVHQGNGTAAILGGDPRIFTLSVHQEATYPASKPPNTIDIGLADDTGDEAYLAALEEPLARALAFRPDLVLYLAGADPFEQDLLGGLKLTFEGLFERDRRVLEACRRAAIPVAVSLAGGYALRHQDTVTIHFNTVAAAAEVFSPDP